DADDPEPHAADPEDLAVRLPPVAGLVVGRTDPCRWWQVELAGQLDGVDGSQCVGEVRVLMAADRLGSARQQDHGGDTERDPHPERGTPSPVVEEHARKAEPDRAADERARVVEADALRPL